MRKKIVTEAMSWIGTPYGARVSRKHKGADCATFALQVFKNVGLIPGDVSIPDAHRMWIYGKNIDPELFRKFILKWFEPIGWDNRQEADIQTFLNIGHGRQRIESHVGVLQNRDVLIHATEGAGVHRTNMRFLHQMHTTYRHRDLLDVD